MTVMTTIKVPTELRDRLSDLARLNDTTLAGAISLSLQAIDEAQFWRALDEAMTLDPPTGLPPVPPVRGLLEPEPEWDD
ncbi:MAG: hypothetical protein LBI33_01840 [Propionibacteriaceae bacterium]|jgi:predicted transcriptional regulator|nr:hypothetical protein [Propionibacteriaceae bacterium]